MPFKRIKAFTYLGIYFGLHTVQTLFRINRRHKKHFLMAYRPEQIYTISPEQRRLLPDYSRCYCCYLCDTQCPGLSSTEQAFTPPSYIAGTFSRSLTDFKHIQESTLCDKCHICEEVCPQNVPIKTLMRFMQEGKEACSPL